MGSLGFSRKAEKMKLNLNGLKDKKLWEEACVRLPEFDIEEMRKNTEERPKWIHFGAGNIFRVFIASAMQDAIEAGKEDTGIATVFNRGFDQIETIFNPFDLLTMSVLMDAKGMYHKRVIGSIASALALKEGGDVEKIKEIFRNPSLQMVSFTITEKGYGIRNTDGSFLPDVLEDIKEGPVLCKNTMAQVAALLYERYKNGAHGISVVSMDNCSHNGDKVKDAVVTIASEWLSSSLVEEAFIDYLNNEELVGFPYSMIDKITPRPAESVSKHLTALGIENMELTEDERGFNGSAFVNSEITEYLIVEDWFPNGRPDIESKSVIFTSRETVNKVETMKVTTCLNPLHTALAVTGCLLGHTLIADQMKDDVLLKLVKRIGYDEGLKVVVNPDIINPKTFIDEVVYERLANPNIPDTPQRIATDTSQKIAIRFGETIKSFRDSKKLDTSDLVAVPLALASWLRYLVGLDDNGNVFKLSPDPLLDELVPFFADIKLGDSMDNLSDILNNHSIFGLDLYQAGLGLKVETYFNEMLIGKGAVRDTLNRYL